MNANFDPQPVTLTGRHVRLEPLAERHLEALTKAGMHPEIWRYIPIAAIQSRADMDAWYALATKRSEAGNDILFAIVSQETSAAIGSTCYLDIQRAHRGFEIGGTWITPAQQRTGVNTECKYLLLSHAFDKLGAIRVCLKTDSRNEKSQRAIERIGAKRDGILRNHYIMPDGYFRDSVYYSIIAEEWPAVKANLEAKRER